MNPEVEIETDLKTEQRTPAAGLSFPVLWLESQWLKMSLQVQSSLELCFFGWSYLDFVFILIVDVC